jgi:tetratricopeptide (TPR) repeat protein
VTQEQGPPPGGEAKPAPARRALADESELMQRIGALADPHPVTGGSTLTEDPHPVTGGVTLIEDPHPITGGLTAIGDPPPAPAPLAAAAAEGAGTLSGNESWSGVDGSPPAAEGPPPDAPSAPEGGLVATAVAPGKSLRSAATEPGADRAAATAPIADVEIERELGRGGMGVVFLAKQRSLERPVAVKTLHPALATGPSGESFRKEAQVTGRLEHPNIPPVHLYGLDAEGQPFLCMKLVRGHDWAVLLRGPEAAKHDLHEHLEILERVCEAVSFAHAHGVIHRDLKPSNVMVGEFGEVLVMDWGLAMEFARKDAASPEGEQLEKRDPAPAAGAPPRGPIGTPRYMPPELAVNDPSRMGPWTDVYLLGAILYEVLTGTPPHQGSSLSEVLLGVTTGDVEPPEARAPSRAIPAPLSEIAMHALAREPEKRFPSAAALAQALRDFRRNEASMKIAAAALEGLAKLEARIAGGGAAPTEAYSGLAACVAELRQAIGLWSGNRAAEVGLARARVAYARFALAQGDLALAEAQLAEIPPGAAREEIEERRRAILARRAEAERRRRRATWAALGALGLAVLLAGGFVWKTRLASEIRAAKERRERATRATEGIGLSDARTQIAMYEQAVKLDPTWAEAHAELGRNLARQARHEKTAKKATGMLDRALPELEAALAIEPDDPDVLAARAYVHQMRGDGEEALADDRRVVALAPETHVGYDAAAEIALHEGRFADAAHAAAKSLEHPCGREALDVFRYALALLGLGDMDGALKAAEHCESLKPREDWYAAFAAILLFARGEDGPAAERILNGLRWVHGGPHLASLLMYHAARTGDRERALALAAHLREARTTWARAFTSPDPCWRAATQAPGRAGEIARVVVEDVDVETLIAPEPAPSVVKRRQGEALFAAGELDRALAAADEALADDPLDGGARLLRARVLAARGHVAAARTDLALVPALAPDRAAEAAAAVRAIEGR